MKKKKRYLFTILIVLLVAYMSREAYLEYKYKSGFVDNGLNQPYSQKIPLCEMDFNRYNRYLDRGTVGDGGKSALIELPCDVEYYEHKEDSDPTYVLKKGTPVYISSSNLGYGYGLCGWPDYDSEWRYARPFKTEAAEQNHNTMRYVKEARLERVAEAIYDTYIFPGWSYIFHNLDRIKTIQPRHAYVDSATTRIDDQLYRWGIFCPPRK